MTDIHFQPPQRMLDFCARFGAACFLYFQHAGPRDDAAGPRELFVAPLRLGQAKFYYEDDGELYGVLTWAWVTDEILARISASGSCAMHISEWREGDNLLIVDLIAAPARLKTIKRDIVQSLFPDVRFLLSPRVAG